MSEKYKIRDPFGIYFMTITAVGWVDVFTRPELRHVVVDSLRYCQQEKGLTIYAWCLMPSHLHLISSAVENLSGVIGDFKKFTSKQIIDTILSIHESRAGWMLSLFGEVGDHLNRVKKYKVWQDGYHPILLNSAEITRQKLNYVHNNPVADEIVDEPEEFRYSSARDYYTKKKGLIRVTLIE